MITYTYSTYGSNITNRYRFALLRKAMKDLGTDEDLIISIFKNRNNGQRYMMK